MGIFAGKRYRYYKCELNKEYELSLEQKLISLENGSVASIVVNRKRALQFREDNKGLFEKEDALFKVARSALKAFKRAEKKNPNADEVSVKECIEKITEFRQTNGR